MKVFVAGPRAVNQLNENITNVLDRIIRNKLTVLLGDANGIDRLVQSYFAERQYPNVVIYASNGIARNNIGKWQIQKVFVPSSIKGFEFYAQKDIQMANDADNGFMIWNGKSKGTLNNIIHLTEKNKKVKIYLIPRQETFCINTLDDIERISQRIGGDTLTLYNKLVAKSNNIEEYEQLSL